MILINFFFISRSKVSNLYLSVDKKNTTLSRTLTKLAGRHRGPSREERPPPGPATSDCFLIVFLQSSGDPGLYNSVAYPASRHVCSRYLIFIVMKKELGYIKKGGKINLGKGLFNLPRQKSRLQTL